MDVMGERGPTYNWGNKAIGILLQVNVNELISSLVKETVEELQGNKPHCNDCEACLR